MARRIGALLWMTLPHILAYVGTELDAQATCGRVVGTAELSNVLSRVSRKKLLSLVSSHFEATLLLPATTKLPR